MLKKFYINGYRPLNVSANIIANDEEEAKEIFEKELSKFSIDGWGRLSNDSSLIEYNDIEDMSAYESDHTIVDEEDLDD